MPVVGIGFRQVADHRPDSLGVRPRRGHALLRAAQLRRGDHLHRLRDLLRALDARDLRPDFFAACHCVSAGDPGLTQSRLVRAGLLERFDDLLQVGDDRVVVVAASR